MSAPARRCEVAVVGAGITGLTAAFHLARAGVDVVVLEAEDRPGGAFESHRVQTAEGHWHFETGPNTVLESYPEIHELIHAAGLGGERIEADPQARRRYIWQQGRLLALPSGPGSLLRTPLLSLRGKLRLLAEPLIPAPSSVAASQEALEDDTGETDDSSIADFVHRRLGREVLESAVAPFVSGIFAGDPERLSVRWALPKLHGLEAEHGSLVKGLAANLRAARKARKTGTQRRGRPGPVHGAAASTDGEAASGVDPRVRPRTSTKEGIAPEEDTAPKGSAPPETIDARTPPPRRAGKPMINFRAGLEALPQRLVTEIRAAGGTVRLGSQVRHLKRGADGLQLSVGPTGEPPPGGEGELLDARRVLLTVPADVAARLLDRASGGASAPLAEIPYAPVAVISLGVPTAALSRPLDGFGFLVSSRAANPDSDELRVLGCLFPSSIFPSRTLPPGSNPGSGPGSYPGRAPEGHAALSVFVGGRTDPTALDLNDDDLLALCRRDLELALGLPRGLDLPVSAIRRWSRAIPQYELGHARFSRLRDELERDLPGLHLAGSYLNGISVPDRIRHATEFARQLARHLHGQPVNAVGDAADRGTQHQT